MEQTSSEVEIAERNAKLVRMCVSKRGWLFHHMAAKRAANIRNKNKGPAMRVYKCPFCPLYHLSRIK
jgi:hypothetical protein